jgi:hypothetical protein
MPLLVCHLGWMSHYAGDEGRPDKIVGGGRWVDEHEHGGEVCNFLRCANGKVYGHVETIKKNKDRPIRIELLGAANYAEFVDGVDVVWTATHPQERGRRVVGFYRDARVYRNRQNFRKTPSIQHRRDELSNFRIQADAGNALLIPLDARGLRLGQGKGWIGQANWWFPEQRRNASVQKFIRDVRSLMNGSIVAAAGPRPKGKGRWGGDADPEKKAEVERSAISIVKQHYSAYDVESVENENLGWDLHAMKSGRVSLRLEVKGLYSAELKIGLTPREYRALKDHIEGRMDNYRLCVVTNALAAAPRLTIFQYNRGVKGWVDDSSGNKVSPAITVLEAATVSLP